jgi:hypothetical protein
MNSVFNCPICWQKFNRNIKIPLTLNCGHVICKNCVKTLSTSSNTMVCSLDKITNTIDLNKENLPICYTILEHLPKEDSSDFCCKTHPTKKIKYYCSYDNESFCSKCLVSHTKNAHKVVQFLPKSI